MSDTPRILVVEDSKFFNNLVSKSAAKRVNAEVVSAMTFAETRAAVETSEKPFSLALVDIILPDAPEGEAVDWLVEHKIPCIVFTGLFSPDIRERVLAQNIIDYVLKDTPSSLAYLMNLVERLHKNRDTTVLIVDDSRAARHHIRNLLTGYQFQVVEASNGKEALAALETNSTIRMIITDYYMPDMNGIEMVKRIRTTHDQERLVIIGLSSGGGSALSAEFIKHGANDFINKPFLPEEFFCRVMQNIRVLDMVDHLTDMATKDSLTGIHNRRFFFDAGETFFANAKRDNITLTSAMIDVDYFKKVNDTYGHDVGDAVLTRIAKLLRSHCRQSDIVARIGGEEFAILAVNMDEDSVLPFFNKIRTSIEAEVIEHTGRSVSVTASFGISRGRYPNLDRMLKTADDMLYKAKLNGRNRVEIAIS